MILSFWGPVTFQGRIAKLRGGIAAPIMHFKSRILVFLDGVFSAEKVSGNLYLVKTQTGTHRLHVWNIYVYTYQTFSAKCMEVYSILLHYTS